MLDTSLCKSTSEHFLERYTTEISEKLNEKLSFHLMTSLQEVRREDPYTYEILEGMSRKDQREVLETFLEFDVLNIPGVTKLIGDSVNLTINKTIEENSDYIDHPDLIMEEFVKLYKKEVLPTLEEGVLVDTVKKIEEIIKNPGDVIKKYWPTIGVGLTAASMYTGFFVFQSAAILTALVVYTSLQGTVTKSNSLLKNQMELVQGVLSIIGKIGKMLKDASKSHKMRFAVAFKNEEKCYRQAGIDPESIGIRAFSALRDESLVRMLMTVNTELKLDKLRNCYLESYLDKISIFFDLYNDCLRKTGAWSSVRTMPDDKYVQMFRVKGGLYPLCEQYRENAKEALDDFEDMVDFFFEKSPQKKTRWKLLLARYIIDHKTPQDKTLEKHHEAERNDRRGGKPFSNSRLSKLAEPIDDSE